MNNYSSVWNDCPLCGTEMTYELDNIINRYYLGCPNKIGKDNYFFHYSVDFVNNFEVINYIIDNKFIHFERNQLFTIVIELNSKCVKYVLGENESWPLDKINTEEKVRAILARLNRLNIIS